MKSQARATLIPTPTPTPNPTPKPNQELDAMAPPGFLLKVVTVQLDDVRLRLLRATDGSELLCCTLGGVAVPLPSPEPNPNP